MKYLGIAVSVLLMIWGCGSSKTDEKSYEQHKESLVDKEKKNPLRFLSVSGDHKKNLIGQTVIKGIIHNKASLTSYKDVRIRLLSYSENKMVEEHEDVIGDILKPNSEQDFTIRYRLPKGTDSVALSVMSASVAETETATK